MIFELTHELYSVLYGMKLGDALEWKLIGVNKAIFLTLAMIVC